MILVSAQHAVSKIPPEAGIRANDQVIVIFAGVVSDV